jgi:LuxR family maltose regulon positive regulatory protein
MSPAPRPPGPSSRLAIVEAKLKPPHSPDWLSRPHCLRQLDDILSVKLSLLLAPAGSGKSTLLGQWIAQLPPTVNHAWFSVEPGDNDAGRFFYYLLAAVKRALPEFRGYLLSHLDKADSIANDMIDAMISLLARLTAPLVIVLDDMQCISDESVHHALQRFLQLLPPQCHVVWSSRQAPPFSVTTLKLERQLFQLGYAELCLSTQDIVVLSQRINGQPISESDCHSLHQLTEGWVAGVMLALIGGYHPANPQGTFSGAHIDVVDYLGAAVLQQLSQGTESFLLQSSIFNRLNADLCNEVLQRNDSAMQLHWLSRNQLFVQSLDPQSQWLRYHALFREFLHNQLLLKMPTLVPELQRRASRWFNRIGEHDTALTHARLAGDDAVWLEALADAFGSWFKLGEFGKILQWNEAVDENLLLQQPRLMAHLIAALLFARRFNQATYHLDQLAAQARRNGDADTRDLVQFLTDALEFFQNDDAFRGNQKNAASYAVQGTDLMAFSQVMYGYYLLLHHNHTQAMRQAENARIHLKSSGHHFLASYGTLIQILVDRAQCRMLDALERTEAACAEVGNIRNPEWVNVNSVLSVVRYEQNQIDVAAELCRELLPHLSSTCATEVITAVYVTLSRICVTRGAFREGGALLNHLSRILSLGYYDRFTSLILYEKARLAYATGNTQELAQHINQSRLLDRWRNGDWRKPRHYDECWQRHGQALAYYQLANRADHDAQLILETLSASADRAGCHQQFVILQAMRAICYDRMQQPLQSLQCMQQAILRGGWASMTRGVFDEAVGFAELLRAAIEQKLLQNVPETYLSNFADILQCKPVIRKNLGLSEPFTDKEAEIVALLSEGLSNKAISERAGIAIATTKWHLKNIYTKLNVQNRTEAVIKLEIGSTL